MPSTATQDYVTKTDASGKAATTSYNALGQIQSVTGSTGTANYGYDANGNLTAVTDGNNNQTAYSYDIMNQLRSETDALGNTWAYTYNGDGTLLTKTSP